MPDEIVNDHDELKREAATYKDLEIISTVGQQLINNNYLKIKKDIAEIIENEMDRMMNTPGVEELVVKK